MIRKSFLFLSAFTLSSCSVLDNDNIAPGYKEAYQAISNLVFGYQDSFITTDLINNIPYASSTLTIGKGPKGLIILESKVGEKYIWTSADGVYLTISNGRIIETSGLSNNLVNVVDPFNGKSFPEYLDTNIYKYYYSYDRPALNNLELEVTLVEDGREEISILDTTRDLRVLSEFIENKEIGWKVENKYWVDKNMFVWKSEQHISPKIPKLVIEVTKKPSL